MRRKSNIPILIITSLITFLVVTIIDLMTPLGYSQWLLYIFPLLIIYISEKPGLIYLHLVLIAFALLIGYIYSPIHPTYENIRDISKLNRIEGFFVFLTFSIIINKLINSRIHFRKLSGELAYANSELESFSYSAAHDLKAPLRTMKGFSQYLLNDYGPKIDEQANDCLRRIIQSSDRMSTLIDDLLSLSKISLQEINLQEIDITDIAESIIEDLKSITPNRNVEVQIDKGMKAKADLNLMRLALNNLIANAWKYTSKNDIALIRIEAKHEKNITVFSVKDNGCGFDMKFANNLFAPFKRLHSESEFRGTGIGLSIVDRVIRKHGGRVWGEGEVGKGASFYFTLPR